jgi:hypothetical protein
MDKALQDFIAKWNGNFADFDGKYGAQCFDLVQYWSQAIGGPFISGAVATDISHFQSPFYTWVPNTPTNVPAAGDIIVWDGTWGNGAGHTGVALSGANVNNFQAIEQNNPTGHAPQILGHNYNHVLGWLHPNIAPATNTEVVDTTMQDQLKAQQEATNTCQTQLQSATENNKKLQDQIVSDGGIISGLRTTNENIQQELEDVKLKYANEQTEVLNLNAALEKLTGSNKEYQVEIIESSQVANKRQDLIKMIADAAGVTYDPTKEEEIMTEISKQVVSARDNAPQTDTFAQEIGGFLKNWNIDGALQSLGLSPLDLNNLQDPQELAKIKSALDEIFKYASSKEEGKAVEAATQTVAEQLVQEVRKPSFLSSLGGLLNFLFRKPSTSIS